jgi:hypothetical protein
MRSNSKFRWLGRTLAVGAAAAFGVYGMYAGVAWCGYGRPSRPSPDEQDDLLDRFVPVYDVVERHHVRVAAPPEVTLEAAKEQELFQSPIVHAIVRTRELVLGAVPDERERPGGLLEAAKALGWGVLAEVPGREIVVGAVTTPWDANVTFRALPPDEFASFAQPGFVKIAWTLRADASDDATSIFRTETRAMATDATAGARFRRYWALVSPGIALIRRVSLGPVKREAERRARNAAPATGEVRRC